MSDRDALLAAVIAAPDDDVPRLVYADYLDDVGGEANAARAAFIRAEIAAEALPADDPERERLETAAAGLFNRYGETWNRELPGVDGDNCQVRYGRGFPDELAATYRRWLTYGERLLMAAPITWLRLMPSGGGLRWPSKWDKDLRHITTLQLGPGFDFRFLTESPRRRRLVFNVFDQVGREQSLMSVRRFILGGNRINNATLEIVLQSLRAIRFSPSLATLDLSDNLLTDAGLAYLAAARGLEHITTVNVRGNPVTQAGVDVLRERFGDGVIA